MMLYRSGSLSYEVVSNTEKVFSVKLLITNAAVANQNVMYIVTFRKRLILTKLTKLVVTTVRYTQKLAKRTEASKINPLMKRGTS